MLLDKETYSDVVREAQELVEPALKGVLRQVGMEPPHWHDVGSILREHHNRLPRDVAPEHYTHEHAQRALDDAEWVVSVAARVIG